MIEVMKGAAGDFRLNRLFERLVAADVGQQLFFDFASGGDHQRAQAGDLLGDAAVDVVRGQFVFGAPAYADPSNGLHRQPG